MVQLCSRTGKAGADGADWDAEYLGGFAIFAPFNVHQDDAPAHSLGEHCQGLFQLLIQRLRQQSGARRIGGSRRMSLYRTGFAGRSHSLKVQAILPSPSGMIIVDGKIGEDAKEPRAGIGPFLITAIEAGVIRPEKSVLRQVLRAVLVPQTQTAGGSA